ncbi:MAG TPA: hypothetical protein PKD86_17865 [Gemmatales bacterium]|nr:hypothetical protein [Gemmatales bacterium]
MIVLLKKLTLLGSNGRTPLNRLTTAMRKLSVEIELESDGEYPDGVDIEVRVQEPGLKRLTMSATDEVKKLRAKRVSSLSNKYRVEADLSKVLGLLKLDSKPEVATVRRVGGTSDALFRNPMTKKGWALRGVGVQPAIGAPDSTGNENREEPDARMLMQTGGVEVVRVSVPPQGQLTLGKNASTWGFIRSPADVFFYTGHGAWWDGSLLREEPNHGYSDWMLPDELLQFWKRDTTDVGRSPMDLDVLFINGCSVIYWDLVSTKAVASSDYATRGSHALDWAKLLLNHEGPLYAICSYRATAPLDKPWGNQIGAEMGQAIANGLGTNWKDYPRKWLEINAKYGPTQIASAVDTKGYWYLNHPKHEGYDPKKPKMSIMGPIPLP